MAEIGLTETSATSEQLIAALVQETLKQKSILLGTVTDYSAFARPGSSQVGIPRRDQFAAADKTENTPLTAQELTFSTDTISLTKNKAIFASLERIAELQANVDVDGEILKEMAAELALQVDKDIITELDDASAAAPDHIVAYANATDLQVTDITEARRLLNVQNVPMTDRWMVVSPDQEKAVLNLSNFIEVDKYGSTTPIQNGELGMVYGFRVKMHTEAAATDSYFYHKSCIGIAFQMQPEFKTDDDLKNTAREFLLNEVYGLTELDSGKRQVKFNTTGA